MAIGNPGHKGWGCNDPSSAVSDYQVIIIINVIISDHQMISDYQCHHLRLSDDIRLSGGYLSALDDNFIHFQLTFDIP